LLLVLVPYVTQLEAALLVNLSINQSTLCAQELSNLDKNLNVYGTKKYDKLHFQKNNLVQINV